MIVKLYYSQFLQARIFFKALNSLLNYECFNRTVAVQVNIVTRIIFVKHNNKLKKIFFHNL